MTFINAVKLFDDIVKLAQKSNASDIHLEPRENDLLLRFRVDGLMQEVEKIKTALYPALLNRIKILANIDTAQTRMPQDGRISFEQLDLRVSTLPIVFGEKVVIRLLNKKDLLRTLTELGMRTDDLVKYQQIIQQKQGMVLVTGPTGSGKTTTLYSSLQEIYTSDKNITTVEDPIEYRLENINQVQVNEKSGLNFPIFLRAVLRQDPDVIMVGEIRDLETAQIAIRASLTGHLVFATLHTNSAVATIIRLIDMGIADYLISSSILGIVAQRLIPKKDFGRIGVFELLLFSEEIKAAIKKRLSQAEILGIAKKEGMLSLSQQIAEIR